MGLTGIVAEAGALLHSEGEVGSDHGLEVAEAADDGAVVPRIGVGWGVGVVIEGLSAISRSVVRFDVAGGGVEADHVEDAANHARLFESDGAVGVSSKASAEVVLEFTVIGEVIVGLEGLNFGCDEFFVGAEEAGVVDVEDKGDVGFGVKAGVDGGLGPAAGDEARVEVVAPGFAGVFEAV